MLFANDGAGEPLVVTGQPTQPPLGGQSSGSSHSAWWQLLLRRLLFAGGTLVRRWGRR